MKVRKEYICVPVEKMTIKANNVKRATDEIPHQVVSDRMRLAALSL